MDFSEYRKNMYINETLHDFSVDLNLDDRMAYHMGNIVEFTYKPDYTICNTSYYSDVDNRNTNGLLMARVCASYSPSLWKFRVSSNDLSTFYLADLIQLLNYRNTTVYKDALKHHHETTKTWNLIDYDELKNTFEYVDSLRKMSNRLKIIGTSSSSIKHEWKRLNIGVCIQGQVSNPDNVFIPITNFVDTKVHDLKEISDFLTLGIKKPYHFNYNRQSCRYALGGSILYLLIVKRNDTFDYIVLLSEEPISVLNQALMDEVKCGLDFDYIYTVIGKTNTKDDSIPYIITSEGIAFKDIILYCNENSFSLPVISTNRFVRKFLQK